MTNWQELSRITSDQARRNWAARCMVAQLIAAEIPDAAALVQELDAQWETLERIHDRLHHQCRRIDHKQNSNSLGIEARENFKETQDEDL